MKRLAQCLGMIALTYFALRYDSTLCGWGAFFLFICVCS